MVIASCRTWLVPSVSVRSDTKSGANHFSPSSGQFLPKDETNPYFTYDPAKCIVCNRCVRACEEVQGTFALTIAGRGFESRVSPGLSEAFLYSRVRFMRRLCPGLPNRHAAGEIRYRDWAARALRRNDLCLLRRRVWLQGGNARRPVVRMMPWKAGKANEGHSCVKGRFAYGYAKHKDRITKPMIRDD